MKLLPSVLATGLSASPREVCKTNSMPVFVLLSLTPKYARRQPFQICKNAL